MDPDRAKQLLAKERRRIEAEIARLDDGELDDELSRVDQHLADAGSDLFERERDHSLLQSLRDELAAIGRAEERLEEGLFGLSVESGEAIPDPRLEVQPWAERTVKEQTAFEAARRYR